MLVLLHDNLPIFLQKLFAWKKVTIAEENVWDSCSTEDIIKKIKEWDKYLYEIVVDRYSDKIYRYLYNYFNFSDRIAKDVTQEVFLHVWNKLDKYKVERKFESRLYRLAHNLSIDWLKKHSKNEYDFIAPTVKVEEDRWELDVIQNYPDDFSYTESLNTEYKKKILWMLMNKLKFKYKEVIILYYFEKKWYTEIADILWTNENSIWTLLHRWKEHLKNVIQSDPKYREVFEFDL